MKRKRLEHPLLVEGKVIGEIRVTEDGQLTVWSPDGRSKTLTLGEFDRAYEVAKRLLAELEAEYEPREAYRCRWDGENYICE